MSWDKGENFLTTNTFNNLGDTAFPLNINYVNSFLYAWDSRGDFGLGQANTSPWLLPIYLFAWSLSFLGLPLWVINRLWHVLPHIFIGLGAFYLYKSFFNNRYSWVCGTIASVFIMLLPDRNIFPPGGIGFAGALFLIGAIIRGLFSEYLGISKKNAIGIFSIGVLMSIHYFRCFYISFITIGLIIILSIYCYKKKKRNYFQIFKFVGLCFVVALLVNLYWIIPMIQHLAQDIESPWASVKILEARKVFRSEHQAITNPLYIVRGTTGGNGFGRPSNFYFSHPLILPFTFLVPIFCFLPLVIRNVSRRTIVLSIFSIFFSIYPVTFNLFPAFNIFLRNYIPTFWIMNDPSYWLLFSGSCYGLIIGAVSEHFLELMYNNKIRKTAFLGSVSIIIIILGGGVLFDRPLLPGFVLDYTLYGNKAPYLKIPDEYDKLEKYLRENTLNTDRMWYIDIGGFKKYTWAYNYHMPEMLFFKSPITTVGQGMSFVTPLIDVLSDSVNPEKYFAEKGLNFAFFLTKILNIRYIIVHKDYYGEKEISLCNYVKKKIERDYRFKTVMDTGRFVLYERIDSLPDLIYTVSTANLVIGKLDIDLVSLIAEDREDIEKPLYIFKRQIHDQKIEAIRPGIDKIVIKKKDLKKWRMELGQIEDDDLKSKESKVVLIDRIEKCKLIQWDILQKKKETWYISDKDVEFYIPEEDDYIIKAKVLAYTIPRVSRNIGPEFKLGTEKDLANWSISPRRVDYYYLITDKGVLDISLYFDGDKNEDEFVQMQNRIANVNLRECPHFDLIYKIEDPDVQTIEVVAGIDFDMDGKVNEFIRALHPRPASNVWSKFSCNLYRIIKEKYPDRNYYNLIWLELYPHKLWGVDCSTPEKKGKYRFWIKKLEFYNYYTNRFFKISKEVLNLKMDSPDEIKKWIVETNKGDYLLETLNNTLALTVQKVYVELYRYIDKIDIKKFPLIALNYSSSRNAELILSMDFDNDGVADSDISFGSIPPAKESSKFLINAYKTARFYFPDKAEYYLVKIKLRIKDLSPNYESPLLNIKKLRIYSDQFETSINFNRPVVELDGNKYWFNNKVNIEDRKNLGFEQAVHLRKGRHYLKKLAGKNFKVGRVILEPKTKAENLKTNEPEISFKKINPSRYEVRVANAKEPFWLVLSESYHKRWQVYLRERKEGVETNETKSAIRFTPGDIRYLFKKPLVVGHHVVNGYANGWYIDPRKLNLEEDFTLEIYFRPQSLYYLELGISGLSFLIVLGLMGLGMLKRDYEK